MAKVEAIQLLMNLRRNGITDTATLAAMEQVPRELFIGSHVRERAYDDVALPIPCDQTISQPSVVAMMTQALQLESRHVVLEIGTGSGYQAAILAHIARRVHTIERHETLFAQAQSRFEKLSLRNITAHLGDGSKGWPHAAPYERIMVTAAAEDIPPKLVDQLMPEGVMVLPVGEDVGAQHLLRIRKNRQGSVAIEELCPVRFVPLVSLAS